jgi:hypothetical protein
MVDLPHVIANTEELGRAMFDSSKIKRAQKDGVFHPRTFRQKDGERDLSTDRLSFGNLSGIAAFHDSTRGSACGGWAVVSVGEARKDGRTVSADPIAGNPYHALISLPGIDTEDFVEAQQQHAIALALAAKWVPRPTSG